MTISLFRVVLYMRKLQEFFPSYRVAQRNGKIWSNSKKWRKLQTYKTLYDAENVFYKSGNFIIRHHFWKNYVSEELSISSNAFNKSIQKMRTFSRPLSRSGYFLWGHLKSIVYQTRPTNVSQLRAQIQENIANNPENTLRRVVQNLQNKLTEYVWLNGQHLTELIF